VKLVMTLLARDEADIVDAQIAFHLNAGVDFVLAIDNGSTDGTMQILESYAQLGRLHLIRDDSEMHQGKWVTRLARMAATDFGADWVINSDVDGFWWPRGGSLKDVLAAVPPRFGAVRAMVRNFVPRPGEGFFAERMTVRVSDPSVHSNSPYSPRFQVAHRADPEVTITPGMHQALGQHLVPMRGWYPIDMLHFPIRSAEQCALKYLHWWTNITRSGGKPGPVRTAAYDAQRQGRTLEFYNSYVIDDGALERGLADGTLAIDTRLRDGLRLVRATEHAGTHQFELPPDAELLTFGESVVDDGYLQEVGALNESDDLARAKTRVESLEERLSALELTVSARIRNSVSRRLAESRLRRIRGGKERPL
jgi:hypothetical protein